MTDQGPPTVERAVLFGAFRLLPAQRLLLEGDKTVRLGSRALDLLAALVEQAGKTVRKDELIARAWPDTAVDEASLRVHIAALRKTLGDGRSGSRFIANVQGRGYVFVAPTKHELAERSAALPVRGEGPRGGGIPVSLTKIVGRDAVIADLAELITRRRLLSIVGPGGIGKTSVAVAVAEAVRAAFADGVWYAGLATLQDPGLLPETVGNVLGIALPAANAVTGLTTWLRDRQALIVLDNCEHLIDAAAGLAEAIVRSAPRSSVLATSREPLRVQGEARHRLGPLKCPPGAASIVAGDALKYPAVQLFNERASAVADGFAITDDDVSAMAAICRRLDGMPLALELAAAHVAAFGVKGLLARLDDRLPLLMRGRRTALPRHQTLRATFDWSHDLLPGPEQAVFRRLAAFQGSFTMDAAIAVASHEAITLDQVVTIVANLVDKSLVAADISGAETYYHLLEMARAYALERLQESGEHDRIKLAHAQYFRQLLARPEATSASRSQSGQFKDHARLIDNLRAALDWSFSPAGDTATGIAITTSLTPLWVQMSLMSECKRYVELALKGLVIEDVKDARTEMILHAALGAALTYTTGPVAETAVAWTTTLQLAEGLGDAEYRLRALRGLWSHRMNASEYRPALALANEFCALAENEADAHTARVGDRMAALILHYLGAQTEARRRIEWSVGDGVAVRQSPPTARFLIDQGVAAHALLARVLWLQGFPDQARRMADSALHQAESADHAISRCHALAQAMCPVTLWTGDLPAAERCVAMLIEVAADNALEGWIARGKCFDGLLLLQRGETDEGSTRLATALRQLGSVGSMAEYPAFLAALANGRALAGHFDEAQTAIEQAIRRSEITGECWCVAELLRIKGEILLLQDEPDATAAEKCLRQALDVARRQGALSWELRAAISFVRVLNGGRRWHEARGLLAQIFDRCTEGFETADLASARLLLGETAATAGASLRAQ